MSTDTKEVKKEPEGLEEDEEEGEEGKKPKKAVPPQESATVAGALAGLVGNEKYADVRFVLYEGKERVVIPAHRVVLAAASDVFEAMLYPTAFPGESDTKERKQKEEDDGGLDGLDGLDDVPPIEIKDVKPAAFRAMLSCIYTDTADFKAEDLPDVIAVANKFQLDSLRTFCVNFMQDGVTPDNACSLLITSDRLMRDQGGFALQFIEDNTEAVVNSPGWDTLDEKRLCLVLASDNLSIDEIDLFKGCLRWAVSECRRRNIKVNQQSKLDVLKNVIPLIRFPTMSMTEIATFVSPSQVLTSDQLLEIFTFMGQANEDKKPEVTFPTTARVGSRDKWTLDPVMKSTSITLSNNNMTATNSGSSHSYCLGTQAWGRGKHAWRVTRDSNPTAWLSIGVSHKTTHSDSSYSSATFYGLSSANQRYFAGTASASTSNFTTGPLDVLFDADAGTLSIINLSSDTKHSITGIPTSVPLTPHFGPNSNQAITVKSISTRDYGRAPRQ